MLQRTRKPTDLAEPLMGIALPFAALCGGWCNSVVVGLPDGLVCS